MFAAIALYVSAIALMNLVFAIVNKILPDALGGFFAANSIVWPVSVLVVLVPLLYVAEWFIFRDIIRMPQKKDLWVRRWRIYTTLFLTALTMAGDLIVLINVYLNGEITGRFIWKVLVVFVVSALIFAYYILSRVGALLGPKKAWRIVLAWISAVLVFAAIVGGFIIVGSPAQQRALRFDEGRITDLTNIQYQVLDYWQTNAKLPLSLIDLNDHFTEYVAPVDPETASSYGYAVLPSVQFDGQSEPSFQLCATFDLPSSEDPSFASQALSDSPMIPGNGFVGAVDVSGNSTGWQHSAGHACFVRIINPKLYPARQPIPSPVTN